MNGNLSFYKCSFFSGGSSGSSGGAEGAMPPPPRSPVQTSHKKDGLQRRPHRFHVSCPLPPTRPLVPMLGGDTRTLPYAKEKTFFHSLVIGPPDENVIGPSTGKKVSR